MMIFFESDGGGVVLINPILRTFNGRYRSGDKAGTRDTYFFTSMEISEEW